MIDFFKKLSTSDTVKISQQDIADVTEYITRCNWGRYEDLLEKEKTVVDGRQLSALALTWANESIAKLIKRIATTEKIGNYHSYFMGIVFHVIADYFKSNKKEENVKTIYNTLNLENKSIKKNCNIKSHSFFKSYWVSVDWSDDVINSVPTFQDNFYAEFELPSLSVVRLKERNTRVANSYIMQEYVLALLEIEYRKSAVFSSLLPVIQSEILQMARFTISWDELRENEVEAEGEEIPYLYSMSDDGLSLIQYQKDLDSHFSDPVERYILIMYICGKIVGLSAAKLTKPFTSYVGKPFGKTKANNILRIVKNKLIDLGYTSDSSIAIIQELLWDEFQVFEEIMAKQR